MGQFRTPGLTSLTASAAILFLLASPLSATPPLAIVPFDASAAAAHQKAWAYFLFSQSAEEETNSIQMKLRLIPPGEFNFRVLGPDGFQAAKPSVRVAKPFYLRETEVTWKQWIAVMGEDNHPAREWRAWGMPPGQLRPIATLQNADFPATFVRWQDAREFCTRLGQKEGKMYRLPTEIEWEFACRSGAATKFHFGDDETKLTEYEWFRGNAQTAPKSTHPSWNALGSIHKVQLKRPNAFGLYDMQGNVMEWCVACYQVRRQVPIPTVEIDGISGGNLGVPRSTVVWLPADYMYCTARSFPVNPSDDFMLGWKQHQGFRVARAVSNR